jgi:hypothetical protein
VLGLDPSDKYGRYPIRQSERQISGYLSLGLINPDKGLPAIPPLGGSTPPRTRYGAPASSLFFTLPQASLAFNVKPAGRYHLHVQLDFSTDQSSRPIVPAGQGVGINEAYLGFDNPLGSGLIKLGSFALPFQSWEMDGPFRTPGRTVTPSALGSFFENFRVLGVEWKPGSRDAAYAPDLRLGIFSGGDASIVLQPSLSPFIFPGFLSDAVGQQRTSRSAILDDEFGFYFDMQVGPGANKKGWRGRIGWLDNGGAPSVSFIAPPTLGIQGWTAGLANLGSRWEVLTQYMNLKTTASPILGDTGNTAWYLLLSRRLTKRSRFAVRWDHWKDASKSLPSAGLRGHAITLAMDRELTPNASLRFEFISPKEEGIGIPAQEDIADDLFQARYVVWF